MDKIIIVAILVLTTINCFNLPIMITLKDI